MVVVEAQAMGVRGVDVAAASAPPSACRDEYAPWLLDAARARDDGGARSSCSATERVRARLAAAAAATRRAFDDARVRRRQRRVCCCGSELRGSGRCATPR